MLNSTLDPNLYKIDFKKNKSVEKSCQLICSFLKWSGNGDEQAKIREIFMDCKFREFMIEMKTQFN